MLKVILLLSLVAVAICGIPGGYSDVDVDDKYIVTAANHAAKALSERLNSKFHHVLYKVVKAEKQVVAGMNYRLGVVVAETNCAKNEVEYEKAKDCEFREGVSTYKKCTLVVYRDLKQSHHLTYSGCTLISKKDL